jgi:peptide/nickel transport system substrate-binding protein
MVDVWVKGAVAFPKYDAINFSSSVMEPLSLLKGTMKKYQSPSGSNWGGLDDPEINRLGEQVLATFDPAKQDDLLRQLHEQMTRDAARVFIVSDLNPRALAPNLSGFVQAQSWFQDLTPIVVK